MVVRYRKVSGKLRLELEDVKLGQIKVHDLIQILYQEQKNIRWNLEIRND